MYRPVPLTLRVCVPPVPVVHGLLMVARAGLDDLLGEAPARPGTPLGEPGSRSLPRQTHQRILTTLSRPSPATTATCCTPTKTAPGWARATASRSTAPRTAVPSTVSSPSAAILTRGPRRP